MLGGMLISCDDCVMQHTTACADCVVSHVLGAATRVELDGPVERAVRMLVRAGLVPASRHEVACRAGPVR
jgi:Zn-finger protein